MKINNPIVSLMKNYITRKDSEKLNDLLSEIHSVDLKKRIKKLDSSLKKSCLNLLELEILGNLFGEMDTSDQLEALSFLDHEKKKALFNYLPTDDIVDLLGEIEEDKAKQILSYIDDREEVERILKFDLDTAAGLMTTEFISLKETITVEETIREIKNWVDHAETIYYVFTIDENNRLTGVLSLRELLAAEPHETLQEIKRENMVKVTEDTDQEEAAHLIAKYDLIALPVVNHREELVGIITVDDIVDVIEEEATEDLFKKAGLLETREDETYRSARLIDATVSTALKIRLPWLMIALFGGLLAGVVMSRFETALETVVALAFFIPAIMDMGGNVGTQSATIFVRGLVLGHIDLSRFLIYLIKEIKVGISLGLISGLLVGFIAFIWQGSLDLSLVVSLSMFFTIILATSIGYIIPFLVLKMGLDPAAGSDPLITTIKDVTGLIIYFGLASIFLSALI